jgi:hypothetical protein
MGRPAIGLLAIVAVVGGWLLTQNLSWHEVTSELPHPWLAQPMGDQQVLPARESIRIATFDVTTFGGDQLESIPLAQMLCRVIEQFDVIALQGIVSEETYIVPTIIDMLRTRGNHFDFAVSERTGRESPKQQFAFIYRADRLLFDRSSAYQVLDPDDLLTHEPFVGSFRTQGVASDRAFTFTLVNTLISPLPLEAERELSALWNVWQAVVADGRNEDDVILLGNLRAGPNQIAGSMSTKDLCLAIVERPTDLTHTHQPINLAISKRATVEFTGRSGVFDLVREFNLSLDQVRQLSQSLPTWAECSLYEGGIKGGISP